MEFVMRQDTVQTVDEEVSRLAQSGQEIGSQNVLSAPEDADRAKRRAALMRMRELWTADPSNPVDGVAYQKGLRAE
ncbi:hypothetical protein CSQ96_12755 [Janthinobacterium sp. BJB412]|nr:hypothetical protein CSQ96_12755 [Janthinobacterium sp. BJB412]